MHLHVEGAKGVAHRADRLPIEVVADGEQRLALERAHLAYLSVACQLQVSYMAAASQERLALERAHFKHLAHVSYMSVRHQLHVSYNSATSQQAPAGGVLCQLHVSYMPTTSQLRANKRPLVRYFQLCMV